MLLPQPATGQGNACFERPAAVKRLAEKFDEHPVWAGLTNRGHMMELFASGNGTWTLLVSPGNGLTCMVAAGEGWRPIDKPEHESQAL